MDGEPVPLWGIGIEEIVGDYHRRGLASWPDARLIAAVGAIVARPRRDPADSFVLHAPLELAARSALLPRVDPPHRELARLHLVALAAQYEGHEPMAPADAEPAPVRPENDPVAWLATAIAAGDLDEVDRAASAAATALSAHDLASALSGVVLTATAAAAHAPIFLHHLARRDPIGGLSTRLLRPLARELARDPEWRVRWIDGWHPAAPTDPETLNTVLSATPLLGVPGSTFIHQLLMQVDESGLAAERLAPAVGTRTDAAARAVLRTAARSMLLDTAEHAPYGWTHCLTLPQAVLSTTRGTAQADAGLAMAATHVAAFRAGLGTAELLVDDPVDLAPVDPVALVTAAATSHDAHIVKYVLACLEASQDDPSAAPLFLAAGQRLLDVWAERGGDPTDPLG